MNPTLTIAAIMQDIADNERLSGRIFALLKSIDNKASGANEELISLLRSAMIQLDTNTARLKSLPVG